MKRLLMPFQATVPLVEAQATLQDPTHTPLRLILRKDEEQGLCDVATFFPDSGQIANDRRPVLLGVLSCPDPIADERVRAQFTLPNRIITAALGRAGLGDEPLVAGVELRSAK